MKDTVHLVLQGKGGVGKSLVASMIAQYFIERDLNPVCADTDPVNSTFHQLRSLNVALVPITEGGAVVQRLFDPLFETVIEATSPVIVDNGASTFLPMVKYLKANDVFTVMEDSGKQTFIHAIVTGGQAKDDTAHGLLALFDLVSGSNAKVVVWQNEFWGVPMFNGVPLEKMKWMKDNSDKVKGIVKIIDRNNDAFATDMRLMSEKHMTVSDVKASEEFKLFAKSRIYRVFSDVYAELDAVFGLSPANA
jgi:hypothetical protein